jgi:anaerobic magnesium-protoporphyrin IX monomethyl ester cyclase
MPTLVLLEPPYVFWDRTMDRIRDGEESVTGWGVLVLAAVARQHGWDVAIVDAKGGGITLAEATDQVIACRPDVLGISGTTISITNGARIAAAVKERLPELRTVVGGPHLSAAPEATLHAFPQFDYGIVGEGEIALFTLLDALAAGTRPDELTGVVCRTADGDVRANMRAPYIDDLDSLPFPAWDLLGDAFPHRFGPSIFNYRCTPVATIVSSRGCPFSCTFCDRSTSGTRGRYHGVEYVMEMCRALAAQGTRHVLFYDDLFTVKKKRVIELCEAMIRARLPFTWSCNSHPNLLDLPTLRLMKRAGCWQVAYGIESGSQRVLNVVKHEVRLPRLRETLRLTRAAGIRAKGYLMIGHPTEDLESLEETRAFLAEAELDVAQVTKFTPYPGTPAYPNIAQYGTFTEDWDRMNAMNFTFIPTGLSEDVLETYFHRCYRAFYSRPRVLVGLVRSFAAQPSYVPRFLRYARAYLAGQWRRRHLEHATVASPRPENRAAVPLGPATVASLAAQSDSFVRRAASASGQAPAAP